MWILVKVLTQSNNDCLLFPGRIIKLYYDYSKKEYTGGISYWSCGCNITSHMDIDFKFEEL